MSPRIIIAAQAGVVIGLVGLAIYQARQLRAAHDQLTSAQLPAPDIPVTTNLRPIRLRLQQLPPINIRTEVQKLDWRHIESEDYATYVANLRAVGCPEATIRDIILADIDKLYAERRRALEPVPKDWDFWRHPDEVAAEARAADAEAEARELGLQALEQERRQLLTRLLGAAGLQAELDELREAAFRERDLQFLPQEKRAAAADALGRWNQAQIEARALADPAAREAMLAEADRALDAAFAASLTPEEREQYELRANPIAEDLRESLRGFGASKEEFEQLFRLEQAYEKQREALEAAAEKDPQAAAQLEAIEAEHQDQLKAALGPERFAEFERSRDPDFQNLYSLALDHQVPTTVASEVWEMRAAVDAQARLIRDNPLLTAEQKRSALMAVREETHDAIVGVLGEPLLEAYERSGGHWLEEMTQPFDLLDGPAIPVVENAPPPVDPDLEQAQALPPP